MCKDGRFFIRLDGKRLLYSSGWESNFVLSPFSILVVDFRKVLACLAVLYPLLCGKVSVKAETSEKTISGNFTAFPESIAVLQLILIEGLEEQKMVVTAFLYGITGYILNNCKVKTHLHHSMFSSF